MEKIYINEKNYKDYLNLNVIAFSFALGGAQGSGGEIIVITKDAKTYSMNYVFGNMKIEMCDKVCPPLKGCVFGFVEVEKTPIGWEGISLGAGNFLVLSEPIYHQIKQELLDMRPCYRYRSWKRVVINCLKQAI